MNASSLSGPISASRSSALRAARQGLAAGAAVSVMVALGGCSMSPTNAVQYEQYNASEFPDSSTTGPLVSLIDDGTTLRVERVESPYCASVPVGLTQEDDVVSVTFDLERSDEGTACPDVGAWIVSDIQLDQPITSDEVTLELESPFIYAGDSVFVVAR